MQQQVRIGYRFRLYPTPKQGETFERCAGCARAVWNAGIEQREMSWGMNRVSLSYIDQGGVELTEAKEAFPWLREPHADVLQQALRDLDQAYRNFFAGRARRPRFRRKGRERFRIQDRSAKGNIIVRRLSRRWGEVRVPKLGWVRFRWTRQPVGRVTHLTISRASLGWHISLSCKQKVDLPTSHAGPPVGIDRGVAVTVALSSGDRRTCPGLSPGQSKRLTRLTRKAGRQETARRRRAAGSRRRSARHQRTLDAISRLRAREARIRRDFLHKLSHDIAKNHGTVVVEALRVTKMTSSARGTVQQPGTHVAAKAGLNRAILAQGWGELRRQLAYKLEWRGGNLIEVSPAYTSQRCASCGSIDHRSRQSQTAFACVACGHRANADLNAAQNILAAGLGRDSAWSPLQRQGVEARTARMEVA